VGSRGKPPPLRSAALPQEEPRTPGTGVRATRSAALTLGDGKAAELHTKFALPAFSLASQTLGVKPARATIRAGGQIMQMIEAVIVL
jgi:hypothetical protein